MSDPDRWQRVEDLFDRAADLSPADRTAFLDAECRTADGTPDPVLRAEVAALLDHDVQARQFFDDANARLAVVADGLSAEQDAPPARVGPWRLEREIGRGGMGTVHLAQRADGRFEQTAALKLVRAGMAPGILARFRAERQILARLDHPGIARLLDGGVSDDGRPYLVMEFVDGEPITDYCDRHTLDLDARIALFRQVCDAVQFAHRQLVVHRDLKPSNILVAQDDDGTPRVKLLDFGIAKLLAGDTAVSLVETATDQRVMTPEYAAPEQVRGEPVTTATDVYALGVLLYEMLTGSRPYRLESRARHAVERAILDADPTVPSTAVTDAAAGARASVPTRLKRQLRGDLDQIVLRALRKEPERRYDGAAALSADLGRHLGGLPVEAQPESVSYRVGKFARRNRVAVATAAIALAAVLIGAGVAVWQASVARTEAHRATDAAARSARTTTFLESAFASADPSVEPGTTSLRDLLVGAIAQADNDLASDPAEHAAMLTVLGRAAAGAALVDTAQTVLDRALRIGRKAHGPDHPDVAETLEALAWLHLVRDEVSVADSLYDLASEIRVRTEGPDAPGIARNLIRQAQEDGRKLRHDRAVERARRALAIAERPGAPLDLHTDALERLANVLATQAEHDSSSTGEGFAEATALVTQALRLNVAAHGLRHPETIAALSRRGKVLEKRSSWHRSRSETAVADSLTRIAVAQFASIQRVSEEIYGPDHTRSLNALWTRTAYEEPLTTPRASLPAFREISERAKAVYGPDHGMYGMTLHNYQVMLAKAGETERALDVARQARAIYARLGSTGSTVFAAREYYVGALSERLGRYNDACRGYRRALAVYGAMPVDARAGAVHYRIVGGLAQCRLRGGYDARAAQTVRATLDSLDAETVDIAGDQDYLRAHYRSAVRALR